MYNQTHRGTWSICLWIWIFIIKHFYFEVENFLKHKSSKQGHLANHFLFDKSYWVVVEVWSNWKHFTLLIIPPRASSPGPIPTTPSCHCTRSALTENGDVGTGAQVIAGQAWGALTPTLGHSSIPESWCSGSTPRKRPCWFTAACGGKEIPPAGLLEAMWPPKSPSVFLSLSFYLSNWRMRSSSCEDYWEDKRRKCVQRSCDFTQWVTAPPWVAFGMVTLPLILAGPGDPVGWEQAVLTQSFCTFIGKVREMRWGDREPTSHGPGLR